MSKKQDSEETNNILGAIEQICQEKKLSKEQVLAAIEQAMAAAYRKDFGNKLQNIKVEFNPENGQMNISDEKLVVEDLPPSYTEAMEDKETKEKNLAEINEEEKKMKIENDLPSDKIEGEEKEEKKRFNPKTEIQISEVKKLLGKNGKKMSVGEIFKQELQIPSDFGRIAAQTAKQVIIQRLREAEREAVFEKYKNLEKTVVNGIIQRRDRQAVFIDLGDATAILPFNEQVNEEKYYPDQKIKVYVVSADQSVRGSEIIVSRRHPDILRELFKLEIPEVNNEVVEIKGIAREAGSRSKVAVWTKEKSIDPIGACIGQRGVRIQTVISEIGGEKIDIIEYDENIEKYIANAMAPAKISSLKINEQEKTAIVKVNGNQLSLAIGRDGQNVRLAAKLTGWRIDIQEEKEEKKEENLLEVKKEGEEKIEEKISEGETKTGKNNDESKETKTKKKSKKTTKKTSEE
jgi:N utilization substance protein A